MHAIAFHMHLNFLTLAAAAPEGAIHDALIISAFTRASVCLEALREEARLMTGHRRDAAFEMTSEYSTKLCQALVTLQRVRDAQQAEQWLDAQPVVEQTQALVYH